MNLVFLKLAESVLEKFPSSVAALLCTAVACICQSLSQSSGGSSKVPSTAQDINSCLLIQCTSQLLAHFYAEGSIQGTKYYWNLSTHSVRYYLSFYYYGYGVLNITGVCQHTQWVIIYHFVTMGVSQGSSFLVYLPTIPSLLFFWTEMCEESNNLWCQCWKFQPHSNDKSSLVSSS